MTAIPDWTVYALMPLAVVGAVAIGAVLFALLAKEDDGDRWR
jgi:hypothetical protein